ncbi:uncharacterized protein TNCV_4290691 [Trichonephila clavipes]|nr:uncharacterized protein TNCV_4290691 [Trichonephila clavipes]
MSDTSFLKEKDQVYKRQDSASPLFSNAECSAVEPGLESRRRIYVRKCIVNSRHGDTINSRRAASPLMRLVEEEERWEAPDHHSGAFPQNWGGNEPNRIVTCMVLKATDKCRRHLALCHDKFREPRSGFCPSGGISNNKTF